MSKKFIKLKNPKPIDISKNNTNPQHLHYFIDDKHEFSLFNLKKFTTKEELIEDLFRTRMFKGRKKQLGLGQLKNIQYTEDLKNFYINFYKAKA